MTAPVWYAVYGSNLATMAAGLRGSRGWNEAETSTYLDGLVATRFGA